ncbi:MAG: hypothetical protein sL5_08310 [Candidatus Mesenet longicola]|uniref:Uncharacterized protein n=1 Tax=Candidatus Mesenet longicola TaxID=1892558 RepID=A0A8J3MPA6_9RICK|nr:MAG: hypothetical protein sGL2_06930 [Candidatus Mesenet longicola]GHM59838.1 MAG: hypothetical protein sL5_08310 [Candidatus Mesenet longicola]
MQKKELVKLYHIFINDIFVLFPTNTRYCNEENLITIMLSFVNQNNDQFLPSIIAVTSLEEKGRSVCFCYHAAFFVRLSLEQDSYSGLLYEKTGWDKDKIIKHIKNYIHDEKYSQIFHKVLEEYLSDDYTFDTVLKGCLDTRGNIVSKAKRGVAQRKSKMTHKPSTPKISFQPLTTYDSSVIPYGNIAPLRSINTPSVSTEDAIKTNYTVPFIISIIPLSILFCYIINMIIKCYHYTSKKRICDCKVIDNGNKSPQSVSLSSRSESVQFENEKICDKKRF